MIKKSSEKKTLTLKTTSSSSSLKSSQESFRKVRSKKSANDKGKELSVVLSKSNPKNVTIHWSSASEAAGFVFVRSEQQKEEKLFASGKSGDTEVAWIQDGISYEFILYKDLEKKKPLLKLSFTKTGKKLAQQLVNLTK